MTTTVRHQISDRISLAADHRGPTSDRPVLFLHGAGQTRHSWAGTARSLEAEGRSSIALDFRGHGDSDWAPDRDYEVDTLARDVSTLVRQLGIQPVVVGASLGGLTAIVLEGHLAPGTIAGLVLVDIVPNMSSDGADRVVGFMAERAVHGFASLEEVADAVAAYNPHRPRPSDLEGLKKNVRQRDGRWYWHWDPALLAATGYQRDTAMTRNTKFMTSSLHAVSVPLHLVRGRMSDLVTDDVVEEFLGEFPHAGYTDVSEAGHMVAGDSNDAFTRAIVSFLDELHQ